MFQPIYKSGALTKLPWQLQLLKTPSCWPLKRDANNCIRVAYDIFFFLLMLSFALTISAEYYFIFEHKSEILLTTECLCTTFIGTEIMIRIINLKIHKNEMRDTIEKFYRTIYVEKAENEKYKKDFNKQLLLVIILTYNYIIPAAIILVSPFVILMINRNMEEKPFSYRMIFFYDAQNPLTYPITLVYTVWVGFSCICMMISEDMIISLMLCHTAARYKMLQDRIKSLYTDCVLAAERDEIEIPTLFSNGLKCIIQEHQRIDSFAADLQSFFSLQSFLIITIGVFLLCVIAFQIATFGLNAGTIKYLTWLVSSLIEIYVLGRNGQRVTDASEELGYMYYMSNWEDVIFYGDQRTNVAIMKDLSFAIFRSQKAVELSAMKFLSLSLISIERAISTSISYFMFLITMRDRS